VAHRDGIGHQRGDQQLVNDSLILGRRQEIRADLSNCVSLALCYASAMATGAMKAVRLLFGVTFFVLGPCSLIWALASAWRTHAFLERSVAAQGTVVQLKVIRGLHADVGLAPVFTFTADGRSYTITSDYATNPPAFKIGERVVVHYEKGHPQEARLESFTQLWLFDIIGGGLGVVFTLAFLGVIFARTRPPRVYKRSDFPMTADQR
jgi:Protein of unknown function (DUF3592)